MDSDALETRKAQRTLQLTKINIFNIVKSVKFLRDILVAMIECWAATIEFQNKASSSILHLSNALLIQTKQIQDINSRITKLEEK